MLGGSKGKKGKREFREGWRREESKSKRVNWKERIRETMMRRVAAV